LSATVSFQEYMSTPATVQGQRQGGKDERGASSLYLMSNRLKNLVAASYETFG
jgi:hypothetical protein